MAVMLAACARSGAPAAELPCTGHTVLDPGIPGSPGHLIPSPINPNGMSQLAMLMRHMAADMETTRQALETGQPLGRSLYEGQRLLRCSWPTLESQRHDPFDALAVAYLAKVKALDAAPAAQRPAAYSAVVGACRACHEVTCEGPLVVIVSLALHATP